MHVIIIVIITTSVTSGSLLLSIPYISTLSRVFFLKFPFDFIYMVNEKRERSRRRERTGIIRFVLFTYVYFSWMSSECCTTNDDGGPDEWTNVGVDCGVSAYSAGNGWMQRVSCHSGAGHNYRELD